MILIKNIADNTTEQSLSHKMRQKRFHFFRQQLEKLPKPIRILDIGGTQAYWEKMGLDSADVHVTLLNLTKQTVNSPNFKSVVGDATNLREFADKSFDVVFSNSVIEHLFTWKNQQKMAAETMRVGKYFFIQTPNYFFPIEPHFLVPGFQFLPKFVRIAMINWFNLGHVERKKSKAAARQQIEEIRLLSGGEMQRLFPGAAIWEEKFAGLVKSFVAHNFH